MLNPGNSLGKKILTYLVEVIIIILGISISFGLNEWNKQRSDQSDYIKYLENLKQDIRIDSLQMVSDRRTYNRISNGIDYLLAFQPEYLQVPDSMKLLGESFNTLNNFQTVHS